jgi:hypothetical protein
MDPDANLLEQRQIVQRMLSADEVDISDALRLAELVKDLDHWLSKGGFRPHRWRVT